MKSLNFSKIMIKILDTLMKKKIPKNKEASEQITILCTNTQTNLQAIQINKKTKTQMHLILFCYYFYLFFIVSFFCLLYSGEIAIKYTTIKDLHFFSLLFETVYLIPTNIYFCYINNE
jgi:hypothetical protein